MKRVVIFLIPILLLAVLAPGIANATWTGGHDVMGASKPETTWYFAEGCTRAGFNTWLCIFNPNSAEANVNIQYFLENGDVVPYSVSCKPTSRTTISVNDTCSGEHDVSAKVTSNAPVVVERPMYFQYQSDNGGHCAMGVQAPNSKWFFAEGCTQPGFQEYLSVLNPNDHPVNLNFNYFIEQSSNKVVPVTIPANTRYTQDVNSIVPPNMNVSVEIDSLNSSDKVIAERPMYFTYKGMWNGGHDAVGRNNLSKTWDFAEGCTRQGFDTWITLENPNDKAASVEATYMLGTGKNITKTYSVPAEARKTVFVADEVGTEQDVSTHISSNLPIAAERPMYFDYHNKWDGGSDSFGSTTKQSTFYFAEGCTRANFETWVCVQNPNDKPVTLRVNFYKETGEVQTLPDMTVSPRTRITIDANQAAGPEHDISIKAECLEGLPIVVERPMYFDYTPLQPPKTTLTARFIDVGEGNSCIIKISSGAQNFFAMVDTGGIKGTSGTVVSELQGMGCSELNVLVLSHPDADHTGGATAVMNAFKVDEEWDPGIDGSNSKTWQEVKSTIAAKGIPRKNPHSGETYNWAGVQTTVLNPPAGANYSETNDWSIVLVETLGSEDIMLPGDAESPAQQYMMSETFPDIELFEAAHHGADSGYYAPFVNKVHPPNSIISVGPNSYGHPSAAVVSALAAFGNVYRTDTNGDITATVDASSMQITTAKNAPNPNPTPTPTPTPNQGPFVGSKNSSVYHYPTCKYALQIKPENLITFATAQDAVNAGYHPCSYCKPPLP